MLIDLLPSYIVGVRGVFETDHMWCDLRYDSYDRNHIERCREKHCELMPHYSFGRKRICSYHYDRIKSLYDQYQQYILTHLLVMQELVPDVFVVILELYRIHVVNDAIAEVQMLRARLKRQLV